jgi:hypothetical protein
MDSDFKQITKQEIEQLRLAIEFHEQQIERLRERITELQEEQSGNELDDDLFNPDERFPPQFHLDNLESQLDFNLGQVDGFCDLDWKAKCRLAEIAVDHDLDDKSTESIVEMSLSSGENEYKTSTD